LEAAVAAERKTASGGATLRVTWVKSTIGHKAGARGTIRALGLHRLHESVEIADTPVARGMLRRVAFLVTVEESKAAKPAAEGDA
jgi:large subunit ribosomal protein L30